MAFDSGKSWAEMRRDFENTFGAVGWGKPKIKKPRHQYYPPGTAIHPPWHVTSDDHTTPLDSARYLPLPDPVSEAFANLRTSYVNLVLQIMFDEETDDEEKFGQIQVLTANLVTTMIEINQQRAEQELTID